MASDVESTLERLTDEQYERLDIIENSARIMIEGGAGTGKTFLAMELARRHAEKNENVLLVCFSPILASFLNTRIKNLSIRILPIHNLILEYVRIYGKIPEGYFPGMDILDRWFVDTLIPEFESIADKIPENEKYDTLILDEGQDIINFPYITVLNSLLKGGWQHGSWRIFYDSNFQTRIYCTMDFDVLEMLKGFGPVLPRLTHNCRNPRPIIVQTCLVTGSDLNTKGAGDGPDVEIHFYETSDHARGLLNRILEKLGEHRVSPGEITILSPIPWARSVVSELFTSRGSRIKVLQGSIQETFPHSKLTFSTIADFKGLENRFIILADMEDIDSSAAVTAAIYVGMTRARVKLWLLVSRAIKKKYEEILLKNLPGIH